VPGPIDTSYTDAQIGLVGERISALSRRQGYLLPSKCPPSTYLTLKDQFSVVDDWGHNAQSFCVVPAFGEIYVLYPHHTDTARVYVSRYRIDGVFIEGKAFDGVGHGQGLSYEKVGSDVILWTGAGQYEDKIARINYSTGAVTIFPLNLGLAVPGWASNSYATVSLSPDGTEFVIRQVQATGPNHLFFFKKADILAGSITAVPTYFHDDPTVTTTRACQGLAHGGDVVYAQHGEQPTSPFKSRVLFAYDRVTGAMIDRVSIRLGVYGAQADHQIIAGDPASEPTGSWRAGPEGISYAIDHRTGGASLYYNNQSAYSYDKKINRIYAFDDDVVFRTKALAVERPLFPNNASGVTGKPYKPVVKLFRIVYDGAKWVPWTNSSGTSTPSGTASSMFYQSVTRIYEDPADLNKQKRIEDNGPGVSIVLDETYGSLLFAAVQADNSLSTRGIVPALYDRSADETSVGQAHITIVFNDFAKQAGADTNSALAANSARFSTGFDVKIMLIVGMPLEQTYLGPVAVDPDA
jgi:hypothetical protein